MTAALQRLEAQLKNHFTQLAAAKQKSGQPLFALEHCLDRSTVEEMRSHLYASIPRVGMSSSFKHCWLVHSAEHGYTFQGLEFWQSFAALTPEWHYYGDRGALRDWFAWFASEYRGIRPIGRWGQHYTYISWPITHALVPTDLQVQLAQTLYTLRYRLDELILLDHTSVGRMLARRAEWPSTRFKYFLEQHELVGRVVRALLEGDPEEPVIYRPTLKRITDDLNAKSEARAWLKDARRHFDRFRAALAAANPQFSLTGARADAEEAQIIEKMDAQGVLLRPALQLRRSAPEKWEAFILIPSFQPLVNLKPRFRDHLARVRYRLPSHGAAQYLGLSLLSGRPVPRRLSNWPPERTSLIEFSAAETFFDRIVRAESQLSPAQLWVFLCHDDGSARHVQGQHLRPGQTYIIVAREQGKLSDLGEAVRLDCAGAFAVRFRMPEVANSQLLAALKNVGIGLHGKVHIEPVSLRPRQWTDQGAGEWLSTETPVFALTCDHEFETFEVSLSGTTLQRVRPQAGNGPTLLALQNLDVGRHQLTIEATVVESNAFGTRSKVVASATIDVFVRHPTTWLASSQLPAAMVVDVNPAVPTLDDFLSRRLEIRAEGDEARTATCAVVLTDPITGEESRLQILSHRLPITLTTWADALKEFADHHDELQLLNSARTSISVEAEDLGEVRIPLHFEPEPLRWALKRSRSTSTLFLVDEGVTEPVSVAYYPFDHPFRAQPLDPQKAALGISVDTAGGLYVATWGGNLRAIAVHEQDRVHSLSSLGAQVDRSELHGAQSTGYLLQYLKLWASARGGTSWGRLKQTSVCNFIRAQLYRNICGNGWADLEKSTISNPAAADVWERLENGVARIPSFAIVLAKAWREHGADPDFDPAQCFCELARKFKLNATKGEARLAWSMASEPENVDDIVAERLSTGSDFSVLLRGARLLHLCRELRPRSHE